MKTIRFVTTALAAGVLILAAGCKSTTTTTTSTTPATTVSTSDNGTTSYSTGTTSTTSSTTTSSTSLADNGTTTTTVTTPATVTPTTVTNPDGTTTTTLANGDTVTRAATTTVVYPNGTVQTLPADGSTTVTTANGTVPAVPPGAAIVTKTVTTITTKPGAQQVAQTVPQPIYITTTPANTYPPPPMTSSTTTIYQPYRSGHGRRFPGFNFLVFADRASFSNSNSSLNGTVNTGQFSSDIRNENGWGGGINLYLGRTNLSTEFTYSSIQPRATFTPANSAFQPITNFRFKMQPITGALQLHFNPRSSVDFYVGGGGAYVMFKPTGNAFAPGTGVRLRDEWGPLVNAGIGFGFSPNFGINFDAKYMWVRANATPTFNSVTLGNVGNSERIGVNPFVVSAGLRFGF